MTTTSKPPLTRADVTLDDVERATRGDQAASRRIVEALHRPILGLIHRFANGGLARDAEDVAQDIFLKIFRNLHLFDPARGVKLTTWIYAIVRNHCYDIMKKGRDAPVSLHFEMEDGDYITEPEDTQAHGPMDQALSSELGEQIDEAVEALRPAQRKVFELREYEGLDYQAIARRTKTTSQTIKSRLHRARLALRSHLEPYLRPAC